MSTESIFRPIVIDREEFYKSLEESYGEEELCSWMEAEELPRADVKEVIKLIKSKKVNNE